MRLGRLAVAVACALGVGVAPVFAASLTVSSDNLTIAHTCVVTAVASSSTVSFDSFVNQGNTGQNNGTSTTMTVNSASSNTRTYVQFDLTKCSPAIPSTATIRHATLRLYATVVPSACRTHDAFRVTSSWTETGITWANQPFGTTINNPASGTATAQMVIGSGCAANTATNAYVTGWNVTADVAAFVAGTATDNGWMIRDDVEGSSTARSSTYESSEINSANKGPQLVIDYTT